jgi:N4-(beta-N-acetylglucosaminyl)-L-asparaginase
MTSRRNFLTTAAVAAAGLSLPRPLSAGPQPGPPTRTAAAPVVIASDNGIRGVARAYDLMQRGEDTLDSILSGINIQELDPEDQSVGLGGLPNEDGVVQLDASVMHGPTKRAGGVAALEGIATPSLVAKAVMDYTDHILLVGAGAKRFALDMGFKEQDLLTEKSRQMWLRWKARLNPNDNRLDHEDDVHIRFSTGTIHMSAVNSRGEMSSATSTSGLSWKIPGRIGDSPIPGAGQYCDNSVGAAGSTGRGEAAIKACGSFLAVEFMRQGMSPEQALRRVIDRVIATTEPRLLNERGRAYFDLSFYALARDGRYAAVSLYEGSKFAVADQRGARLEDMAFVLPRSERPTGRPISGTMPRR